MFKPEVDSDKCIGCEECIEVCPSDVYEMQNEKSVPVNAEECIGCEIIENSAGVHTLLCKAGL